MPNTFTRSSAERARISRETAAAREHFDAFMQRRAAEHRALCFVFRIPSAPVEIPPCAFEIDSREA